MSQETLPATTTIEPTTNTVLPSTVTSTSTSTATTGTTSRDASMEIFAASLILMGIRHGGDQEKWRGDLRDAERYDPFMFQAWKTDQERLRELQSHRAPRKQTDYRDGRGSGRNLKRKRGEDGLDDGPRPPSSGDETESDSSTILLEDYETEEEHDQVMDDDDEDMTEDEVGYEVGNTTSASSGDDEVDSVDDEDEPDQKEVEGQDDTMAESCDESDDENGNREDSDADFKPERVYGANTKRRQKRKTTKDPRRPGTRTLVKRA